MGGLIAPKETQIALRPAAQRELRAWILRLGAFAHFPVDETVLVPPVDPAERNAAQNRRTIEAIDRVLAHGGQQRIDPGDFPLVREVVERLVPRLLGLTRDHDGDPARRGARLAAQEASRKLNARAAENTDAVHLAKLARCARALLTHERTLESPPAPPSRPGICGYWSA